MDIDKKMISAQAMALREKVKEYIEDDYTFDIVKFAMSFGLIVGVNDKINDTVNSHAFLLIDRRRKDFKSKLIGVDSNLHPFYKRFYVVHELGHYFLHNNSTKLIQLFKEPGKNKKMEAEADYFAICMLLPREALCELYNELAQKNLLQTTIITMMAAAFRVPDEILAKALQDI